eukprot:3612032-Pyramimonas_sp.AAC.1
MGRGPSARHTRKRCITIHGVAQHRRPRHSAMDGSTSATQSADGASGPGGHSAKTAGRPTSKDCLNTT